MSCSRVLTAPYRKKRGKKTKTTRNKKSVWLGWVFHPHPNTTRPDPSASQRHRKRERLCVCKLYRQHLCPVPAAPGRKGGIWGLQPVGLPQHAPGPSKVTMRGGLGTSRTAPREVLASPHPCTDAPGMEGCQETRASPLLLPSLLERSADMGEGKMLGHPARGQQGWGFFPAV